MAKFGLYAHINTVTARYVDVRDERKQAVLEAYHQAVSGEPEVTERMD